MHGSLLDVFLILLVVLFGFLGYRQGFIVGALSFVGFIGGGVLGALLAPPLVQQVVSVPAQQSLLAIAVVFLGAALGQFLTSYGGALIRERVVLHSARVVDSIGGALISGLSVLLVAWLVGSALANSAFPVVGGQVRDSQVLRTVDAAMPDVAHTWFAQFRRIVDNSAFPQFFSGLGPGATVEVPEPDPAVLNTEELREASHSIVKVLGTAPSCGRQIEGTGFVFAPERVMTNAHVVAGVTEGPEVMTRSGQQLESEVVLYDPQRDLAVLNVPGLDLEPLEFAEGAESGDDAVVAGFPRNQGFTVVPARVRARQIAQGFDIYQEEQVSREIFQLRAEVAPGNSGGPLLSPDGRVYGVIFAAATDDPETGYALTAEEVSAPAEEGAGAVRPVSTQECD
ncbi:MarP family serine protease [Allonocardiopsis opalescens]|uniref:Colicin V production protein n=1 Tax=Allonocardiopsis opalescens TaxID=1144618 RepID=A0A2T0Q6P3_9ACTN|nr:MarP family serine protease [Allonocardiopsis opalescens]PRX99488.1 colicin V production protein [Allonocardiopsis opalescens]